MPDQGFLGWTFIGGVVAGKPSVAGGLDNAAYIAVRDNFNAVWMARFTSAGTLSGWFFGGGIISGDARVATGSTQAFVMALDGGGALWHEPFTLGVGDGFQGWNRAAGIVQGPSPATDGDYLFVAAVADNGLWWYSVPDPR